MDGIIENTKPYETIIEHRSIGSDTIDKALEIVETFILKKGLILYGGMAIDLALKLKGSCIYPSGVKYQAKNDYDFYSSDFIKDACELAELLKSKGFKEVNVINARHVQAMRVRIAYEAIADLAYLPKEYLNRLPTIAYKKLKLIHPDYQKISMHRALSLPYENPGQEVIYHRWRKDIKRYNLLEQYYPFSIDTHKKLILSTIKGLPKSKLIVPVKKVSTTTISIPIDVLDGVVLDGFGSYAVMFAAMKNLEKNKTFKSEWSKTLKSLPECSCVVKDGKAIFTIPKGESIILSTDDPIALRDLLIKKKIIKDKSVSYRSQILDLIPPRIISDDIIIYNNRGLLSTYSKVKINDETLSISSMQRVLLHFLFNYFYNIGKTNHHGVFYEATLALATLATDVCIGIPEKNQSEFMNRTPFFLSVMSYGSYNWSDAYLNNLDRMDADFKSTPMSDRIIKNPGKAFYLDNDNAECPKFDVADSELFDFDKKLKTLHVRELTVWN
jgi:hypothetical protein